MEVKAKEELEQKIEQAKGTLQEAIALVKICALASESSIIDIDLQMKGYEEYYLTLRHVNSLLLKAMGSLDT